MPVKLFLFIALDQLLQIWLFQDSDNAIYTVSIVWILE